MQAPTMTWEVPCVSSSRRVCHYRAECVIIALNVSSSRRVCHHRDVCVIIGLDPIISIEKGLAGCVPKVKYKTKS